MRIRKNILFTFDYELFLGAKSGFADECLIEPTSKILSVLAEYKCIAVFFVDTSYLLKLKEISLFHKSASDDFFKITRQIQQLILQGHYVFPHIHPHWIDAIYISEENQWDLSDTKKYRFNRISIFEREQIFSASISILNEIILPVKSDYIIDSYRAGGWSIQPFDDFKPLFDKFNIKYDFSVLPGSVSESAAHYHDFSIVPRKKIYRFSEDICKEEANGKFMEFTISNIIISSAANLFNKVLLKLLTLTSANDSYGRGISAVYAADTKAVTSEMISIELMTSVRLFQYNKFILQNDFMHFISHPKMFSPYNLIIFNKFLKNVFSKYYIETDFRNMIF